MDSRGNCGGFPLGFTGYVVIVRQLGMLDT